MDRRLQRKQVTKWTSITFKMAYTHEYIYIYINVSIYTHILVCTHILFNKALSNIQLTLSRAASKRLKDNKRHEGPWAVLYRFLLQTSYYAHLQVGSWSEALAIHRPLHGPIHHHHWQLSSPVKARDFFISTARFATLFLGYPIYGGRL